MVKVAALILVVATAGTIAGPLGYFYHENSCAEQCPDTNTKFFYTEGNRYIYSYNSEIQTHVAGATDETSGLFLGAKVYIDVYSKCDLALTLADVTLQDANPASPWTRLHVPAEKKFKDALELKILRFGFVDGKVTAICNGDDEAWVLNIKRAILSSFQNGMQDLKQEETLQEVDVNGECPVKYQPQTSFSIFGSKKIKKTKDIFSCVESHTHETVFHGIPYGADSKIQSLPIIKSTHECEQHISDRGILTQTTCTEKHVFRPFSRENSGATTDVTSELKFVQQMPAPIPTLGEVGSKSTLHFDKTPSTFEMTSNYQKTRETFTNICKEVATSVTAKVPGLFKELVKKMRLLDANSLVQLYRDTSSFCDKAKKFYSDAIPLLMTGDAIPAIRTLVQSNSVTEAEGEIWITSLTFLTRPTTQDLRHARSLLSLTGPLLKKASLAVSAITHSYCRVNPACEQQAEVQEVMKVFLDTLGTSCQGEHDSVLLALKAIGNVGSVSRVSTMLEKCFNNEGLDTEARVAAINAFRRMPCSTNMQALEAVLKKPTLDAELRISAYLQLMRCASPATVDMVKTVLESEEVNQVGSFIWTHLTNLLETSDPLKVELSKILENINLRKTFDLDKRKFSRNIEWSYFSDMLNAGVGLDSNIIFSQESFLPRSASLNLTTEVFGHAYNIFEITGRIEGVENLLEQLLHTYSGDSRPERSINSGVVSAWDQTYKPKKETSTKASYSLKIFGNEMRYQDFHGFDLQSLRGKFDFLTWLMKLAEQHDFEVTKSFGFLEANLMIPTVSGLPLKLTADGVATVNVKVSGKMDVHRAISSPSHIDIDGSVIPSAALEVTGEMGVDAFYATSGVKMVSTLNTHTHAQGKVQLMDGGFNIDIDTPVDKLEIFNLQRKFYLRYRDTDREQKMLDNSMVTAKKCVDLHDMLGFRPCVDLSMALPTTLNTPMYPLTGPANLRVYLDKSDTMTGYHMDAKFWHQESPGIQKASFKMNTPQSAIDREFSMDVTLDMVKQEVHFNAHTPWKSVDFDGALVNTAAMKSVKLDLDLGAKSKYSLLFEVPITEKRGGFELIPNLEIDIAGMEKIRCLTKVTYVLGRKLEWDAKIRNFPGIQSPAKSTGSIVIVATDKKKKFDVKLDLSAGDMKAGIQGYIDLDPTTVDYTSRLSLDYALGSEKHRFILNNKIKDKSTNSIKQYSMDSQWSATLWPSYNGDASADVSLGQKSVEFNLNAGFDEKRRIKIKESGSIDLEGTEKKVTGNLELAIPILNIDYKASLEHGHSPQYLKSEAKVSYAPKQEVSLKTNFQREGAPDALQGTADITLAWPGTEWNILDKVTQPTKGQYQANLSVAKNRKEVMSATSTINLQADPFTLTTDIKTDAYGNYHASGSLSPDPNSFLLESKVQAMGHDYSAKVTFDKTAAGIKSELTYFYNQQGFTADIKTVITENWSNMAAEMNFKPQYTRASYSQFQPTKLAAQYKAQELSLEASMNAVYGPKAVTLTSTFTKNKNRPVFNMDTRITSPFSGWENIVITGKHRTKDAQHISSLDISKGTQVISYNQEVTWIPKQKAEYKGKFTSPLRGYESIAVDLALGKNDMTYTSVNEVKWGINSKVTLEVTVTPNSLQDFSGSLRLFTPHPKFDRLIISASNGVYGETMVSKASVEYARNQKTEVETKFAWGNQKVIGLMLNSNASPWIGDNLLYLEMTGDARDFDTKLELAIASLLHSNAKITLILKSNTKDVNAITISASSASSVPSYDIGATMVFTHKMDQQLYSSVLKFTKGAYETSAQNTFLLKDATSFEIDTKWENNRGGRIQAVTKVEPVSGGLQATSDVTTSFRGWESLHLTVRHTGNSWVSFNTDARLRLPSNQEFSGNVKFDMNQGSTKAELSIDLPYPNSNINVEFSHEGALPRFHTTGKMVYGNENSNKLSFDVESADVITGMLAIRSEMIPYMRYSGASFTYKPTPYVTLTSEVYWSPTDKITAAVVYKSRPDGFELTIDSETPFTKASKVGGKFVLQMADRTATQAEVYWNKQKISFNTNFQMMPKTLSVSADITTPFKEYDSMGFRVSYDATTKNTNSLTSIWWSSQDKVEMTNEVSLQDKIFKTQITAITSTADLQDIKINIVHEGPLHAFTNKINVEANKNTYQYNSEVTIRGLSNVAMTVTLKTPVKGLGSITWSYQHQLTSTSVKGSVELQIEENVSSLSIDCTFDNDVRLTAELTTPYESFKHTKLIVNHDVKTATNFKTDISLERNNANVYSGSADLTWYGQTFKAEIDADIPGWEKMKVKVEHKGWWTDFSNKVIVKPGDGSRSQFESAFKMVNGAINLRVSLQTPYPGYESTKITATTSQDGQSTKGDLEVVLPVKGLEKWTVHYDHARTPGRARITAKLDTPVPQVQSVSVNIDHNGNLYDFTTTVSVTAVGKTVSSTVSNKLTQTEIDTSIAISTPFQGYEKFGFTLSFDNNVRGIDLTVKVETPFKGLEKWSVTVTQTGSGDRFSGSLSINTPLKNMETANGEFTFSKSTSGWSIIGSVQTPLQQQPFKWEVSFDHRGTQITTACKLSLPMNRLAEWGFVHTIKMEAPSYQSSLTITTPLPSAAMVVVKQSFFGTLTDFTSSSVFSLNGQEMTKTIVFKKDSSNMKVDFTLTSQFNVIKQFAVNAAIKYVGVVEGSLKATHNGMVYVDGDFTLKMQFPFSMRVTARKPASLELNTNVAKTSNGFSGDSSLRYNNLLYRLETQGGQTMTYDTQEITFNSKLIMPSNRDMILNFGAKKTLTVVSSSFLYQWADKDAGMIGYDLEISTTGRRNRVAYDGRINVMSPVQTVGLTVSHVVVDGSQFTTTITMPLEAGSVTSKNELTLTPTSFTDTFTFRHPALSKDIVVKTEGIVDMAIYNIEGKLEATVEREYLLMSGKITDETKGKGEKYQLSYKLLHPSTLTDTTFSSDWTNSRDMVGGGMELNYQMSSTRQVKVIKSRAEYNKINKEVLIQLESPMKDLKVTGKPSVMESGKYRYLLVTRLDQVESRVEFGYSKPDRNTDIQIIYGNAMLKAIAEYKDIKTMKVEVFHQNLGTKTSDLLLATNDKGQGVLAIKAYSRPGVMQDLKAFVLTKDWTSGTGNALLEFYKAMVVDLRYKAFLYQDVTATNVESTAQKILGPRIVQAIKAIAHKIGTIIGQVSNRLVMWAEAMLRLLIDLAAMTRTIVKGYYDRLSPGKPLHHVIMEQGHKVQAQVGQVYYQVRNHPAIAPVIDAITNFSPGQYWAAMTGTSSGMYTPVAGMSGSSSYQAVISDVWGNLRRRTEIRQIQELLNSGSDYMDWAYEHYEVRDNMRDLALKTTKYGLDRLWKKVTIAIKNIYDYDVNEVTVWKPDEGEVELDVLVPNEMTGQQFKDTVVWLLSVYADSWEKDSMAGDPDIYHHKMDNLPFLPPFQAHAFIGGKQHYITFDNKYFEFAGECSYLLARDFIDGSFSLLVNYERKQPDIAKKSITLMTGGKKLEIQTDSGVVDLDGKHVDLPLYMDDVTSVYRTGDIINIIKKGQLGVACNLAYDHCTLYVSGWYFHKTGGLFGTYDYEPTTDFVKSDNMHTGDVNEFAASWVTAKRCSRRNYANVQTDTSEQSDVYQMCAQYFKSEHSPLQGGFWLVDPQPFLDMCINEVKPGGVPTEGFMCKTASLYVEQCGAKGLLMKIPEKCVTCKKPDGSNFMEGDTLTLVTQTHKMADVVFVVQHADCGKEFVNVLSELLDNLESALTRDTFTDTKYGFVGYGGTHPLSPHSHTMASHLMAAKVNMKVVFDHNDNIASDTLSAIRMAAMYPFRTGASKTIVAVPCGSCVEYGVGYSELRQLLIDRDIRLHILLDHDFTFKDDSKTTKLFGADKSGIYTHKNTGTLVASDREIFRHVHLPKDLCATLSADSDGTIFNSKPLTESRRVQQLKYMELLAKTWTDKAQPSSRQQCECVPNNAGKGVSVCRNANQQNDFLKFFAQGGRFDLDAYLNGQG